MIIDELINLPSVLERLRAEKLPIFLYGMGNGAEKIHAYLSLHGIEIKGVVASDGFVRGQDFLGFRVVSVTDAEKSYGRLCLVLCFGLEGEKSHFLKDLQKRHRVISPNLAVFGDGACDKEYILSNIDYFEKVYGIFDEPESKRLYLNILKYNITGDISYLEYGNELPAPSGFFNHSARHIDVGAYDGDTVAEFISYNKNYSDIVAFEPDKNTFLKLKRNTSSVRDCIAVNAAVAKKSGSISFASGGGRASHCGEGEQIISASIDEFVGFTHIAAEGIPVGSIKIDAEGMDEDVICGAVNTIYCCKPSVCVALYHRAEDIALLPLLLRKHNPKYRFYLRKKEYVPAWDVFLYAVPEGR